MSRGTTAARSRWRQPTVLDASRIKSRETATAAFAARLVPICCRRFTANRFVHSRIRRLAPTASCCRYSVAKTHCCKRDTPLQTPRVMLDRINTFASGQAGGEGRRSVLDFDRLNCVVDRLIRESNSKCQEYLVLTATPRESLSQEISESKRTSLREMYGK